MVKYELKQIQERIYQTLEKPFLKSEMVIRACDTLSRNFRAGIYQNLLKAAGAGEIITTIQLEEAAEWLCEASLQTKMRAELGADSRRAYPLGVLLHIGAGNIEGLSAYSIIEGLLTGNINLIKPASDDSGISLLLLTELIRLEPLLEEYIYLLDFSSQEKERMKQAAALADALIIWGGDEAIQSVRAIAAPNQKIIEWGHKISIAYITSKGATEEALAALARHILTTRQQLCSSCQGIYFEGTSEAEMVSFCLRFLRTLEQVGTQMGILESGWIARNTLQRYTHELEQRNQKQMVFAGKGVNLFLRNDCELMAALQDGNIWVKNLPREGIIRTLKKHHGHLQTVGLVCSREERGALTDIFIKAGMTRVSSSGDMSLVYPGGTHDGEFALRRYCKIVDTGVGFH